MVAAATTGPALAANSYVNANVQFHDTYLHGSKSTSTVEVGHNFDTGTRLLMEIDAIPIGKVKENVSPLPVVTLGVEQNLNLDSRFWASVGYHNLVQAGETIQYRPLVKLGITLKVAYRFTIERERTSSQIVMINCKSQIRIFVLITR